MKTIIIFVCCCLLLLSASAQHGLEWGLAITNNNSAFPFSKFAGLFQSPFHPGVELSYGFQWKSKPKHDCYQQVKLAYFYHRFVQHGIELYTNVGYRYKFSRVIYAETAFGVGYLHSIPATVQLKLDDKGEYENGKGIGRAQAMLVFNFGGGYVFNPTAKRSLSAFVTYQQRIQTPFVRSYVPLLPYNSLMVGCKITLKK